MLSRKVEEELLQRLKTGVYSAGEKLPSIREMCEEFRCSYVIAFRAIQALKEQGCLETVKGSGTYVARDLQKHLEKKLLVYIFDKPDSRFLNPQDSLRYTCFQRIVRKSGFMDLALQEEDVLNPEELSEVAGALITLRSPMTEELIARKVPCVFISSLGNHYGMPSVTPDFYQGAALVIRHLIDTGARRIYALTIDSQEFNQASYLPRLQAYREVMKEAGLPVYPPLEWNIRKPGNRERLRDVMKSAEAPDAIFASNDKLAVELQHELNRMGISVPEDIRIAGLENQEFCYGSLPPLTTAEFDNTELVQTACASLLNMIHHPGRIPASVKIPMSLILRESTFSQIPIS